MIILYHAFTSCTDAYQALTLLQSLLQLGVRKHPKTIIRQKELNEALRGESTHNLNSIGIKKGTEPHKLPASQGRGLRVPNQNVIRD